jgi:hypothetical protein
LVSKNTSLRSEIPSVGLRTNLNNWLGLINTDNKGMRFVEIIASFRVRHVFIVSKHHPTNSDDATPDNSDDATLVSSIKGNQLLPLAQMLSVVRSPQEEFAFDFLNLLSHLFSARRPKAGFQRKNGYFPTMCP